MNAVELSIHDGPSGTSVSIGIRNAMSYSAIVVAPHPGNSVLVCDETRQPYSRVRGVASDYSRKVCELAPNEAAILTIDLKPFYADIRGGSIVSVTLRFENESGESWENCVEGPVYLNIPSFEERMAEMKRLPRYRGPAKGFDVSDFSQFDRITTKISESS